MDIALARTFLEIVRTGSFVNAAASMNITQTAVSARIKVLEEQLERPVFVRNKSGAHLTPEGERFLRHATSLVQVWENARRAVALPEGFQTVVSLGGEMSLWNPLLRYWLVWMRRECPDFAVHAQVDSAERLMDRVQTGLLDAAVIYGGARRTGVVSELLFEEKLVMAQTPPVEGQPAPPRVGVFWGEEFAATYQAAFPDEANPPMRIDHGPLALEYILAMGGSGYFRKGFIRPLLEQGQLQLVPDCPEFSYSAYLAHSPRADAQTISRIRTGLRAAVAIMI
ncbi:MAG: LysR family transcriptional regulator [Sphingomonadales bacterium]|nr:LysR family transcriptional regulator [Sphingomonadales bacterium]MDE2169767.1 LysR family transcriptional regulator [Sphingomonadales bacterium]